MSARRVIGLLTFAAAAVGVWWLFSEPDRLFRGLGWLLWQLASTGPGKLLLALLSVVVLGRLLVQTKVVRIAGGAGHEGYPCSTCTYRAFTVEDIAGHEAGHVVVAEHLGYKVYGAKVWPGEGGATWTENANKDPWDQVRISSGGASGENVGRVLFTVPLNGWKSDPETDAGKVARLAPGLAAAWGVSTQEVVSRGANEADRILAANMPRWRKVRSTLIQNRVFGENCE